MTNEENNTDDNKVFVSYASSSKTLYANFAEHTAEPDDKNRERDSFVKELLDELDAEGIEYEIDTESVEGGSITDFENRIGCAKNVVVVLSDKYFISPHCMYEWDMIHKDTTGKNIYYVYFTGETIRCNDGTEFRGKDIPIKDFAKYYEKVIVPALRLRYNHLHEERLDMWFDLSHVEAYFLNGDITKQAFPIFNHPDLYMFKKSFEGIPAILKNNALIRDSHDTAVAKQVAQYIKNKFGVPTKDVKFQNANLKVIHTFMGDFEINFGNFRNDFLNYPSGVKFYGRETRAEKLRGCFMEQGFLWNVVATGGTGKTFFAHKYKEMYGDKYDKICHVYLNKKINEDFVDSMTLYINDSAFREKVLVSTESVDNKIKVVLDVLENVEEKTLLVLDINVTDKDEFQTEFINALERLDNGRWHILVLSRISFKKNVIYLPGFEEEPDTAVEMFCEIYRDKLEIKEDVWDAEKLKNIFGTPDFNYHPLLISVLASYCGRERIRDFGSVEDLFDEVSNEDLPQDMERREGQVMNYLKKLIDFDSYGHECEILLRHFILWEYNNIHYDVIAKFLSKYPIKSFRRYLNDLVNDMILTRSEHEYRINGLTIKEQCSIEYYNSNRSEDWKYEKGKDTEFKEKLEQKYGKLDDFTGYRMHGMIGQVLRIKAKQKPFDYSNYLCVVREQLECMESVNIFRSLQLNIFESLYEHQDLLNPSDDFYLLSLAHYYYFNGEYKWKEITKFAKDVIGLLSVNYEDCYKKLDNLSMSIHDSAMVLLNLREDSDIVVNFLKKAVEIRERVGDDNLTFEEQIGNLKKLAFGYFVISYVKSDWEMSRKASSIMEGLIKKYDDIQAKAMYYQMIVSYHRMAEEKVDFDSEYVVNKFNTFIFNSDIKEDIEKYFYKELSKKESVFMPTPIFSQVGGGSYQMGCNDDTAYDNEKTVHEVEISHFQMGKYPITQIQWDYVMGGDLPSFVREQYHRGLGPDYPMYNITWYEAAQFCNRLSSMSNMDEVYTFVYDENKNIKDVVIDWDKIGYRLPTEAEWEYAARGGKKNKGNQYSGSNDIENCCHERQVAWFDNNSKGGTHIVGQLLANELGLYDMSGNVLEWCQDWYDENFYDKCKDNTQPVSNPFNDQKGSARVLRGGSWLSDARNCRVSDRYFFHPGFRLDDIGFRLSLSPQKDKEEKK